VPAGWQVGGQWPVGQLAVVDLWAAGLTDGHQQLGGGSLPVLSMYGGVEKSSTG
jgi:hypothetical protein